MGNTPSLLSHPDPPKQKRPYISPRSNNAHPALIRQNSWSFAKPENKVLPNIVTNGVLRPTARRYSNPEITDYYNTRAQVKMQGYHHNQPCNKVMAKSPNSNVIFVANKENVRRFTKHTAENRSSVQDSSIFQAQFNDTSLKKRKKLKAPPPPPPQRAASLLLINNHDDRRPSELSNSSSSADSALKHHIRKKRRAPAPPPIDRQFSDESYVGPVYTVEEVEAQIHVSNEPIEDYNNNDHNTTPPDMEDLTKLMDISDDSIESKNSTVDHLLRIGSVVDGVQTTGKDLPRLNSVLQEDIINAANERAKKGCREPPENMKSNHQIFAEELQNAYQLREKRLEKADNSSKPSIHTSQIYKAKLPPYKDSTSKNSDSREGKNWEIPSGYMSEDWIPDQDLDGDLLDGPDYESEITARGSKIPSDLSRLVDRKYDYDDNHQRRIRKKSKHAKEKYGSLRKFKKSMQNAIGSIGKASGKILQRKSATEIFDFEDLSNDQNEPPAIRVDKSDRRPAYAYHPGKGQLILLPDHENVIITKDGRVISETSLQQTKHKYVTAAQQREHELARRRNRKILNANKAKVNLTKETDGTNKTVLPNGIEYNGVSDDEDEGPLQIFSEKNQSDEDATQLNILLMDELGKRRAQVSSECYDDDYVPSWMENNNEADDDTGKQKMNRSRVQKKGNHAFVMYNGQGKSNDSDIALTDEDSVDKGIDELGLKDKNQDSNEQHSKNTPIVKSASDALEDSGYRGEQNSSFVTLQNGIPLNFSSLPSLHHNNLLQQQQALAMMHQQALYALNSQNQAALGMIYGNNVMNPDGMNVSMPLIQNPVGFAYPSQFSLPTSWNMNLMASVAHSHTSASTTTVASPASTTLVTSPPPPPPPPPLPLSQPAKFKSTVSKTTPDPMSKKKKVPTAPLR